MVQLWRNKDGVHLMTNTDYSICGDAFDVHEGNPMVATDAKEATCEACLDVIKLVREYLRGKK